MPKHHSINYIELSVPDVAAAKAFYGGAFGWTFTDYGPGYAGIAVDGEEVGGLAEAEQVTPGASLVVLYSDDLEASLAAVRAAGGRIVVEPFDFPGGRRFHFSDPGGNVLAVWGSGAEA